MEKSGIVGWDVYVKSCFYSLQVFFFFFWTVKIEVLLIIGLEKSLIKYTKAEENYYRNSLW